MPTTGALAATAVAIPAVSVLPLPAPASWPYLGLSGVLTTVCYAITLARKGPELIPARVRIPSYAVWDTVVFALNILAFIFIGLDPNTDFLRGEVDLDASR